MGKSYGDFERVKELLAQEPALIDAVWDWGGGDWETGLGAAAHMGRSDIANYLFDKVWARSLCRCHTQVYEYLKSLANQSTTASIA